MTIVESASTAMSSIIDKYICLANGLPPPDTDIEEHYGGKNKKKQSLVKYLEDHEPDETTSSQSRKSSSQPQPMHVPKSCTEEDIQREVQETLQRRKSQLGLPDDYEVREIVDKELDLELVSDLEEGGSLERKKEVQKRNTQPQNRIPRKNRFSSTMNEDVLFENACKNSEESDTEDVGRRENVPRETAIKEKKRRSVPSGSINNDTHQRKNKVKKNVKEKKTSKPAARSKEKMNTSGPLESVLPDELEHGALLVTDMLDTVFIPPYASQEREKTLMKLIKRLGKDVEAFHFSCLVGEHNDAHVDNRKSPTCPISESIRPTKKDAISVNNKAARKVSGEKSMTKAGTKQKTKNAWDILQEKSPEEREDNLPQKKRESKRKSTSSTEELTHAAEPNIRPDDYPSEQLGPQLSHQGEVTKSTSKDQKERKRDRPRSKTDVVTSSRVPETNVNTRKRSISDQLPRRSRNSWENIFPSQEEKLEEESRNKEKDTLQPLKENLQAVGEVFSEKKKVKKLAKGTTNTDKELDNSNKENNPLSVNSENVPNLTSTSTDSETIVDSKKQKPKIRRVLLSNGRIVFKYKMDSEKEISTQDVPPERANNISENTINGRPASGSILGNISMNLWQKRMWHSKQEESIIAGIDPVKKKRKSLSTGIYHKGHKASDSMQLKWSSMIARNSTVELSSIMGDTTAASMIHPAARVHPLNERGRKQEREGLGVMQKRKMLPVPEHSVKEDTRGKPQNPSEKFAKPQAFPLDSTYLKKINRWNMEESNREAEQSKLLQLYNSKKPTVSVTDQAEQSSSSDEETTLLTVENSSRVVGPFHSSLTTAIKLREQLRDTSNHVSLRKSDLLISLLVLFLDPDSIQI